MEILNRPIRNFIFEDVVHFCEERHIEGIQLDYKRELPSKGLAKDFAAFSNTRGGVIIIGVEEDKKTGEPARWDGIVHDGKFVDRIHQWAANVEPIPSYEVYVTDKSNDKVFILVRIYEGDQTPYYVQNDASIWVRTGNIRNPIALASPDAAELLYGKRQKAEKARNLYLNRAQEVFDGALRRAAGGKAVRVEKAILCTVAIQPFFPKRGLIALSEIPSLVDQISVRDDTTNKDFPTRRYKLEPIPEGALHFEWDTDSLSVRADQIYGTGLVWFRENILVSDQSESLERRVYIAQIAIGLYMVLQVAGSYYRSTGYQGGIEGFIELTNAFGANVLDIQPLGRDYPHGLPRPRITPLAEYKWSLELDTNTLNNSEAFQSYYLNQIRNLHWSLGWEIPEEELLNDFLNEQGWLASGSK